MTQNLVHLDLNAEDLAAIDAALATLEAKLGHLTTLSAEDRQGLAKMGDKSEAFVRESATAFQQYQDVLPRNFDVAEFQADLTAFDTLRSRAQRLERLSARIADTQMALGSDLMTAALEGYAVLKVSGKGDGLDGLRKSLGARFARGAKKAAGPVVL